MTDPIQDFINGGGFRAVADPAGEEMRRKVDVLTWVLIRTYLDRDDAAVAQAVPELVDEIIGLAEFGAGQLACLEMLGRLWQELVGVSTEFMPPAGSDALMTGAAVAASAMTMPTTAAPLGAIQNPDIASGAIVILARQLAVRLDAARRLSETMATETEKHWVH